MDADRTLWAVIFWVVVVVAALVIALCAAAWHIVREIGAQRALLGKMQQKLGELRCMVASGTTQPGRLPLPVSPPMLPPDFPRQPTMVALPSPAAEGVSQLVSEAHYETRAAPVHSEGDRAGVNPTDQSPPESAENIGARLNAVAAPASVEPEEEATIADKGPALESVAPPDAAGDALRAALAVAHLERPVSDPGRAARERPLGLRARALAQVPRPADKRRAPTLPPPASEPERLAGWDERCEVRATRLMQEATREGEDISHCLVASDGCHGLRACGCRCAPCSRRRELEDRAYREIKGPLAHPLRGPG